MSENMATPNSINLEELTVEQMSALRDRINEELEARHRENADDPADVVAIYLDDAIDTLRGRTKMPKSPDVGPAITNHNGVIVAVCYKGDTSRKNSVSRWIKINDEWIWESDRVVADEEDYPDFDPGYQGKISVFALNLKAGDEAEVRNKKTHGRGIRTRTLYEFDGIEIKQV